MSGFWTTASLLLKGEVGSIESKASAPQSAASLLCFSSSGRVATNLCLILGLVQDGSDVAGKPWYIAEMRFLYLAVRGWASVAWTSLEGVE